MGRDHKMKVVDAVTTPLGEMVIHRAEDGDLLLMSTPWGQRGFFHDTWMNRDPAWERICVPATQCERISAKFLDEERTTEPVTET